MVLNDGSCWTIIGVEAVEFTFNQGPSCIQTPVTPFPVITGLEVSWGDGGDVNMLLDVFLKLCVSVCVCYVR